MKEGRNTARVSLEGAAEATVDQTATALQIALEEVKTRFNPSPTQPKDITIQIDAKTLRVTVMENEALV